MHAQVREDLERRERGVVAALVVEPLHRAHRRAHVRRAGAARGERRREHAARQRRPVLGDVHKGRGLPMVVFVVFGCVCG